MTGWICIVLWLLVAYLFVWYVEDNFEKGNSRKMDRHEKACAIILGMLWFISVPAMIAFFIEDDKSDDRV